MKAIVYTRYGTPDVLELKEVDKPIPTADEVLVKVFAVSLNDWDLGLISGDFINRMLNGVRKPKRTIVGSDISGRVERLVRTSVSSGRAMRCLAICAVAGEVWPNMYVLAKISSQSSRPR